MFPGCDPVSGKVWDDPEDPETSTTRETGLGEGDYGRSRKG